MKKGTIVILAVAIIGALGVYSKSGSSSPHLVSPALTSANSSPTASNSSAKSGYKNGTFTGATEDTPYGPVQISVAISGGKISDVSFLQMPSDLPHSQMVTAYSEPLLKQETLQRQNANLDFVSGATSTSDGYVRSLQSALDQAAQGGTSSGSNSPNSNSSPPTNPFGGSQYPSGGGEYYEQ